ncbi:MAG: precorrin-6y C5,15-methyltransferase (decarboxylating) subunit CbiE [Chloroflexota bacterium]|nr:precorrin-6y C5,15-methyltransferase (decarboxylating) subunit CbiE [Chloroflexota bacterium]
MIKGKVYIVGIGAGGATSLSPDVIGIVEAAEILMGGQRLLDMFPRTLSEKVVIKSNLSEAVEIIKSDVGHKQIVVLASGDPNFFGIARRLIRDLGKDIFKIIPNVSSMQLAFARIKESWDDAAFVSVHARPIEAIIDTVRANRKIGVFTDSEHTPSAIAKVLTEHGIDGYRAYVCENLGQESETMVVSDLLSLRKMQFSDLNILILVKETAVLSEGTAFGIPDDEFYHRGTQKGLITKLEVRAISLAKMQLSAGSVVWDIGAGSGSVSIEAAFMARGGTVFAIEKNAEDTELIEQNIRKFRVGNVEVIQTKAPDGLEGLPDPDAVFIGGTGGSMREILSVACSRLKQGGRMVLNLVTLENLDEASRELKDSGFEVETTLVNIARSADIAGLTRFEPLSPVFVLTGVKNGN